MEQICNELKEFLIDELPAYLDQLKDSNTPLPALTANNVKVGTVNIESSKTSQACFIVPDSQNIEDLTMDSQQVTTRVDVFVFVRNAGNDCLFRQALRYAMAVKKSIQNDYTCDGAFSLASVSDMEYFEDVEATDGKVKAVRIGINIIQEMMED